MLLYFSQTVLPLVCSSCILNVSALWIVCLFVRTPEWPFAFHAHR